MATYTISSIPYNYKVSEPGSSTCVYKGTSIGYIIDGIFGMSVTPSPSSVSQLVSGAIITPMAVDITINDPSGHLSGLGSQMVIVGYLDSSNNAQVYYQTTYDFSSSSSSSGGGTSSGGGSSAAGSSTTPSSTNGSSTTGSSSGCPTGPITGILITYAHDQMTLSWNPIEGVDGYHVCVTTHQP